LRFLELEADFVDEEVTEEEETEDEVEERGT
jgi:hypothetical protein